MTKIDSRDAELRFGEWGPGYLIKNEDADFGIVVLRPGDYFPNHFHEEHTESFYVLSGEVEVWLSRKDRIELAKDHLLQARPGIEHYLRNVSDVECRLLFVKSPGVTGDKIDADWHPEAAGN